MPNVELEERNRKRQQYQERLRKQREEKARQEAIARRKAAEDKAKREDKPVTQPPQKPPPYMKQVEEERAAIKDARDTLVNPRTTVFVPTVRTVEPAKAQWRDDAPPPKLPTRAWRDEGLDAPAPPPRPWRPAPEPAMTPSARLFEEQGVFNPPPATMQAPQDIYPTLQDRLKTQSRLPVWNGQTIQRGTPEIADALTGLDQLAKEGIENPTQLRAANVRGAVAADAFFNDVKARQEAIGQNQQRMAGIQGWRERVGQLPSPDFDAGNEFVPGGHAGVAMLGDTPGNAPAEAQFRAENPLIDSQWAEENRARVLGLPYANETPEQKARRESVQGAVETGVEWLANLGDNPLDEMAQSQNPAVRYTADAWNEGKQDDRSWLDTVGTAGSTLMETLSIPQRTLSTAALPEEMRDGSLGDELTFGQAAGVVGGMANLLLNPFADLVRDPESGRPGLTELIFSSGKATPEEWEQMDAASRSQVVWDTVSEWGRTQVQDIAESNKRVEASSAPNADYALLNGVGGVVSQNRTLADITAKANLDSLRAQETWLAANGHTQAASHVRQRIAELDGATHQDLVNKNAHSIAEGVFGTVADPLNALDWPLGALAWSADIGRAIKGANAVLSPDAITDAVGVGKRAVEEIAKGITPGQTGYRAVDILPFIGYDRVSRAHIDNDQVFTGVAQLINGVNNPSEARYLLEVWAQNPNLLIDGISANRFSDPAILAHAGSDGKVRWGANQVASQEIMDRHWLIQSVVPEIGNFKALNGETFNPAAFLAEWDSKAWQALTNRYNLNVKDTSKLASQWLLSDFTRGLAVDLNLNFNPGHWVRNAIDAQVKLRADGIFSARSPVAREATQNRWFGAGAPIHRMFEARKGSAVGQSAQIQQAFGATPIEQFASEVTGNPNNWYAKAQNWAQENWMGNRRVLGVDVGEQANFANGMDGAFGKLLGGVTKDWSRSVTQKMIDGGVDPALAKEFTDGLRHTILNGSGDGMADIARYRDEFLYGENLPINLDVFGIADETISTEGWARIRREVQAYQRHRDDELSAANLMEIIEDEKDRFAAMLRANPQAVGSHAWTSQNITQDAAATLDEIEDTAAGLGVPVPVGVQQTAAQVTAQQTANTDAIAKEFAGNPDMVLDIWRDMQDLRDTARRELQELNAIARNASGDDKVAAWETYWNEASRVWDEVLAKEGELLVRSRQQMQSGEEYVKRWSRWKDIDRYIEWDAAEMRLVEDAMAQQSRLGAPVPDSSPLNVSWRTVIDGHRAIGDRSRAVLAETVRRYASPDTIDIMFDTSRQQEMLGKQVASYLAEQRELVRSGALSSAEYAEIRNTAWAEYFQDVVVLNEGAARYAVLRGSADEIGANISWKDASGKTWTVEGVTDDVVFVRDENGLSEQMPRSSALEPYVEQYNTVLASVDGRIDEVMTDIRASTGGELSQEDFLATLDGVETPGTRAFATWQDMKDRAESTAGADAAKWQEFNDWLEREIPEAQWDEYLGMTPDEVIRRAADKGIAPPPSIDRGGVAASQPATLRSIVGVAPDADRQTFQDATIAHFVREDQTMIGLREEIDALPLSQGAKDRLYEELSKPLAKQLEADYATNGYVSGADPAIFGMADEQNGRVDSLRALGQTAGSENRLKQKHGLGVGRTVDPATGEIIEAPELSVGVGRLGTPKGQNAKDYVWSELRNNGLNEPIPFGGDVAAHSISMLDDAYDKLTRGIPQFKNVRKNNMTWQQRRAAAKMLDSMPADVGNIVYSAARQAKTVVDRAMIDNTHRRGFDNWLGIVLPFHYFWTRSGANWARRMVRKPSMLNFGLEMTQATQRENEQQELPVRLQGSVPYLNLPSGVQLRMQNPLLSVFPWIQYAPNRRFMNEDEAGSDFGKWYNGIRQWAPGLLPHVSLAADVIQDMQDPLPNGETRVGRNYIGQYVPQYEVVGQAMGALGMGNPPGSVDNFQPYRIDRAINILGVSGNVPSSVVAYARQIVYNQKNGLPLEEGIPPAQFQAANALYEQGVQQASGDRLATIGGRMGTGIGGYVWRPEEQELARQTQTYFGAGWDAQTNPYGSKENQNQVREGMPGLGNWLNKGVNAPFPDPEMNTPVEQQQLSEYMNALGNLSEAQQREISYYLSQNPNATEEEIWAIRNKYADQRKQVQAQFPNVQIPEGTGAGMNPAEQARKIIADFIKYQPPNKPVHPGDKASPEEKAAYYKARGEWEQKRLAYIDKNARYALQQGENLFNEQGILEPFQSELNRMLEGEYAANVERESEDQYRSTLEAAWQNQVDFEKELSDAERKARAANVEKLTGYSADEWAVYAAANADQKRALAEQNPAYYEMAEAAYHPEEYAEGEKRFGDDWYQAVQSKPKYPGADAPEAEMAVYNKDLLAWQNQYPNGEAARFWYYGRYQETPEGEAIIRDYGKDYAVAIDTFGDVFSYIQDRRNAYARGKEAGWAWDDAHPEQHGRIVDFYDWQSETSPGRIVDTTESVAPSVDGYTGARPVGTDMLPITSDLPPGGVPAPAGMSDTTMPTNTAPAPSVGLVGQSAGQQQAPAQNPFAGDPANGGWWVPDGSTPPLPGVDPAAEAQGFVDRPDSERFEQSQAQQDFQNSRNGIYTQFGDTVGYLWDKYYDLPKDSQQRKDFLEQNPELRLTFAWSNSPEKYAEAQELFGDDALTAWAFKPPAGDARKEYYLQNPAAWAVNAWMYGRWDDEKAETETDGVEYNFGADWNAAIEQFGADIWEVAVRYRSADKAGRNAMWDDRLEGFWAWWYGPREEGEQTAFAGDGSAPLYHEGDFAWQGMTYNRYGQLLDSVGNVAMGGWSPRSGGGGGGGGGSYPGGGGGGGSAPRINAQDMDIRSARVPNVRVEEVQRSNVRPTSTRTPDDLGSWRPRSGLGTWRAGNVDKVAVAKAWRS